MQFNDSMATILNNIKAEGKFCYIMGDFNLNLLNANSHNPTNDFIDLMYSYNFIPLINKPTRVGLNSATLIDNVFTNNLSNNILQGILYSDISDHFPIFMIDSTHSYKKQVQYVCSNNFSMEN